MDAKLKEDWVAALRSGTYEQGRGRLKTPTCQPKYCCIGVLCDVINPKAWNEYGAWRNDNGEGELHRMLENTRASIGLSTESHNELIKMNDERCSFEYIADYIENHVK